MAGPAAALRLRLPGDAAPQDRRDGGLLRRVRTPVAHPDQARVHEPDAVKEARDHVARAGDMAVLRRQVGVQALLERGDVVRQQVGARVRDDKEADGIKRPLTGPTWPCLASTNVYIRKYLVIYGKP